MDVLLIDHQDSFTYNIVQLLKNANCRHIHVLPYSQLNCIDQYHFEKLIISPGPGLPSDYPDLKPVFDNYIGKKPVLGICLGHQALAMYFGAKLKNLNLPLHGEASQTIVTKSDIPLFYNIPELFDAGRYHSWFVDDKDLPDNIEIIARTVQDNIIMAFRHTIYNIYGLQFHPESILTPLGQQMINNWYLL